MTTIFTQISPEWKQLLDSVGVTHEQLKDKKTAELIYNFVEEHGGIEAANRQLTRGDALPTSPSCQGQSVSTICLMGTMNKYTLSTIHYWRHKTEESINSVD